MGPFALVLVLNPGACGEALGISLFQDTSKEAKQSSWPTASSGWTVSSSKRSCSTELLVSAVLAEKSGGRGVLWQRAVNVAS